MNQNSCARLYFKYTDGLVERFYVRPEQVERLLSQDALKCKFIQFAAFSFPGNNIIDTLINTEKVVRISVEMPVESEETTEPEYDRNHQPTIEL